VRGGASLVLVLGFAIDPVQTPRGTELRGKKVYNRAGAVQAPSFLDGGSGMRRLGVLLAAFLLWGSGGRVRGGEPDEAARKAGESLPAKFQAFDPALGGDFWLGVYRGDKNIATLRFTVDKAPDGSGGAYRCRLEMKAPGSLRVMDSILDTSFATLSQVDEQSAQGLRRTTSFRREGGAWACRMTSPGRKVDHYEIVQPVPRFAKDAVVAWKDPGRTETAFLLAPGTRVEVLESDDGKKWESAYAMLRVRAPDAREGWVLRERVRPVPVELTASFRAADAGPNHGDLPSMFLLCRALAALGPRAYALKNIRWPTVLEPGDKPVDLGAKAARGLRVEAKPAGPFTHRGRETVAVQVRVDLEGEPKPIFLAIAADRSPLAIWSEGDEVRMIAGTEPEARQDLGYLSPDERLRKARETAKAVFTDYYRAMLETIRAKQEIENQKAMDAAAQKHGFKDWIDFSVKSATALGAEEWMKVVKEVTEWFTAEMEKLTREMAEEAARKGEEGGK
jgi:hypothetical protein